jgi:hypothetical protein
VLIRGKGIIEDSGEKEIKKEKREMQRPGGLGSARGMQCTAQGDKLSRTRIEVGWFDVRERLKGWASRRKIRVRLTRGFSGLAEELMGEPAEYATRRDTHTVVFIPDFF